MSDTQTGTETGSPFPSLPGRLQRGDIERILTVVSTDLGLSSARLRALCVMMQATRPQDWRDPCRAPVCYMRQQQVAARLGITPRALRAHEVALERAGLIARHLGADGSRGCFAGGRLIQGISFSPLIARVPALIRLHETRLADEQRMQVLRRQISAAKRALTRSIGRLLELQPDHPALPAYLQALRNQLNSQRQREAERALESTELLAENSDNLPAGIVEQFKVNRELSAALNQQAQRMDLVASQQRQATNQTLQVRQALNTLREQSQWLGSSNLLGEALRAQVARLPEMPKPQQLDTEMAQLRVQRLHFEDLLNKQPQIRQIRQADGQPLTSEQNRILEAQLRTQRELLNSLLQGGDTLILELTKLKVSNSQLEDALKEVNEATHRYLFWTSDVRPMTFSWPIEIVQDLRRLISLDTFSQLGQASVMMLTSKETIFPLLGALILVGFSIYSRRHFTRFLERVAEQWVSSRAYERYPIEPLLSFIQVLEGVDSKYCIFNQRKCLNYSTIYPDGSTSICDNFSVKDFAVPTTGNSNFMDQLRILAVGEKTHALYILNEKCTSCQIYAKCSGGCLSQRLALRQAGEHRYEEYCRHRSDMFTFMAQLVGKQEPV